MNECFYVYMLRCADKSYYVGRTTDIEKRLAEHRNRQAAFYTSRRLPVELVFFQTFANENEAYSVEQQIKGWSRAKKEALIESNWTKIKQLSRAKVKDPSTGSG